MNLVVNRILQIIICCTKGFTRPIWPRLVSHLTDLISLRCVFLIFRDEDQHKIDLFRFWCVVDNQIHGKIACNSPTFYFLFFFQKSSSLHHPLRRNHGQQNVYAPCIQYNWNYFFVVWRHEIYSTHFSRELPHVARTFWSITTSSPTQTRT